MPARKITTPAINKVMTREVISEEAARPIINVITAKANFSTGWVKRNRLE
ncbi:hypothetical protein [Candidatus Hakubella thermalkaliphila]|nr:hypothetical protein [Candidatus Hakubella thermalkaliphila]